MYIALKLNNNHMQFAELFVPQIHAYIEVLLLIQNMTAIESLKY
jgi:hypothetical protein